MIYLVIFILFTIITQVLLKQSSIQNSDLKVGSYLTTMFRNHKVLFAYALSGINVFVWILALTKTTLLIAFFVTSSIYVIMVFVDHYFFNQKLNSVKFLGAFFISIGVILSML